MSEPTILTTFPIRAEARGAPELTVVVPCFNERPNVAPLVDKLDAALFGIAWEVVFVDDNSPDGTTAEVRRIAQTDPRSGLGGDRRSVIVLGALHRCDRRRPSAR
jgi:dolichol-phosphate mannosyltransferase